jgi:hypothetical protein
MLCALAAGCGQPCPAAYAVVAAAACDGECLELLSRDICCLLLQTSWSARLRAQPSAQAFSLTSQAACQESSQAQEQEPHTTQGES